MAYRATARTEARRAEVRERILRSARALVGERGFAGVSMLALARGAGIATGTLYRYFPSKTDLCVELFRLATRREVEAVRAAMAAPGVATAKLARGVEMYGERALRSGRLAYALIAEPLAPELETERLRYRATWREIWAAVIAAGVDAGELPPQPVAFTAAAIVGALAEAVVPSPEVPHSDVTLSSRARIEASVNFILNAVNGNYGVEHGQS
ncbi:TetR/AcrR family transcriptional regulator [Parahaliea mediterranea]|uniref:TetR/AcrR family transcriptional regulator n=1 Tax=Parahaliea mediterranea TaxID=651086 RepID=A0A939DB91_9GAMM|nr:TetR/AcrR family transcriptional regulator [Parahaliea mediterranea]MBN7795073.1 TetR/AcrR family transcriptional regulator [Parahaliea mediterranea]